MTLRGHVMPALLALVGLAILVRTTIEGGGATGYLLGVLFVAAGAGRIYAESRR